MALVGEAMIDATTFFEDASESLSRYERNAEKVEQWKIDHDEATKCFQLEQIIAFGLSIYNFVNRIDETWRLHVHNGLVTHEKEFDDRIADLYKNWLKPCQRLMRKIRIFENAGFDVSGSKEFEVACREVKGILTDDSQFFTDDELSKLRDSAVEEHAAGDTEPLLS